MYSNVLIHTISFGHSSKCSTYVHMFDKLQSVKLTIMYNFEAIYKLLVIIDC